MKVIYRLLWALTLCFCNNSLALAQESQKSTVGVYVTGDAEPGIRKVIASKLVSGITNSDNFTAIERTDDFLSALAAEQDYQLSGAVSDNHIARIGQQLGVKYVLVAAISNVYDEMFISARLIDTETAHIYNTAEALQKVSDVQGLMSITNKLVDNILWVNKYSENDIQKSALITDANTLLNTPYLSGYHIATPEEIKDISKDFRKLGKDLSFPIYTDITKDVENKEPVFEIVYYDKKGRVIETQQAHHYYDEWIINYKIIFANGSINTGKCIRISDSVYKLCLKDAQDYNYSLKGLNNMERNDKITSGYIYFVKNK